MDDVISAFLKVCLSVVSLSVNTIFEAVKYIIYVLTPNYFSKQERAYLIMLNHIFLNICENHLPAIWNTFLSFQCVELRSSYSVYIE